MKKKRLEARERRILAETKRGLNGGARRAGRGTMAGAVIFFSAVLMIFAGAPVAARTDVSTALYLAGGGALVDAVLILAIPAAMILAALAIQRTKKNISKGK